MSNHQVTRVSKKGRKGTETASECVLSRFPHFFHHSRRTPSLARLLARLFDLSAWKTKGYGCYAGYSSITY